MLAFQLRADRGAHDNAATGQSLANIIIRIAKYFERDALAQERA